jgi:hypothetical protein
MEHRVVAYDHKAAKPIVVLAKPRVVLAQLQHHYWLQDKPLQHLMFY